MHKTKPKINIKINRVLQHDLRVIVIAPTEIELKKDKIIKSMLFSHESDA